MFLLKSVNFNELFMNNIIMTGFKIQSEDGLVQKIGYAEVDDYLKELVKDYV